MFVIARKSRSQDGGMRIVRDPSVPIGETFAPLTFAKQKDANTDAQNRGADFFVLNLGAPKKGGKSKSRKQ